MDNNTTNNGDNQMNTDANIPESFKQFIASGESVIQTCRELMEENAKIRKDNMDLVGTVKQLTSRALKAEAANECVLQKFKTSEPEDYQTLKDFKGEMDAIHEEFDIQKDVSALRDVLSDWKEMRDACDNHLIEYADLDSTLEEKDQYDNVLSDHNITDASDLEDTLTDMEDAKAYEKGFNELAEFVEKFKEMIGYAGEDIPATDMEDYK